MYERRNRYLERKLEDRARNRRSMRDRYDDMSRDRRYDDYRISRDGRYYDDDYMRYDSRMPRNRRDYDYRDYARDYADEDENYKEDLRNWNEKLKAFDRFKVPKEQIIVQAKNMGVDFKDFDEDEFYTTYLMMLSDYKSIANDYNIYVKMANDFLNDKDASLKGSEKLCAYMYEIVMGD